MKKPLEHKTSLPQGNQDYVQLWFDNLCNLNCAIFWRYVRFFGIVPKNYQNDKYLVIKRLMKANYVTESFARKELIYLGKIKQ
jgi:hypothetical protein